MKPPPLKGRTWNPYTIPDVIDPGGVRCVKVYIPDSLQWLQIFAAVMDTMCHWKNYELMGDTSASQCAALMRSIMQQYNTFLTCTDPDADILESWDEDLTSLCEGLRFQNGKLQAYCCGEWSDITGQPSQGWLPGATGTGTTPPAAGGCSDYQASLSGNGYWYAPFIVSTGDTIVISDAVGATYNPANGGWYCPDGSLFFAGICGPSTLTAAGNPMPAILSGKLVAKIGSTFYDVYNGTFTVPAGISTQPVQFQINYASIATSAGDITFKARYCNNAALSFTHTFDFTVSPWGWTVQNQGSGLIGSWIPGTGFVYGDGVLTGNNVRTVSIVKSLGATRTLTDIKSYVDYTYGSVTDPAAGIQRIDTNVSTWVSKTNANYIAGSNVLLEGIKTEAGVTAISNLLTSYRVASGAQTGNIVIRKIVVSGVGSDPF